MSNRGIVKRTYYTIRVTMSSPVNIANGVSIDTDADVMRNGNGECFIPGTSLAGAFRNYIECDKKKAGVFGFADGEDGRMSSILVSDMYFDEGTVTTSVRDRVNLTENKSVDNKFNVEIIETGAKGTFRIETVVRENDEDGDPDETVDQVIIALQEGDIRLGSAKNRGFGRVSVESVSVVSFDQSKREEWIRFLSEDQNAADTAQSYEDWKKSKERQSQKYNKYKVPLRLTGGISIRRYSAQPDRADFEHITSAGTPVIPGTSWNGAIRADARQLIIDMGIEAGFAEDTIRKAATSLIDKWFGIVKSSNKDGSRQSEIVIAESRINGSKTLPMTRNNINRFTAGTKDGALYTELSCIGGSTDLEYMIAVHDEDPKKKTEMKALDGIMRLVVRDICEGFTAVGGQVAVGRGIFSGNYDEWLASLTDSNDDCLSALYEVIREEACRC